MSSGPPFPKRLIEDSSEGPNGPRRRMLESAMSDAPPPKVVAAAILAASRAAHARPKAETAPPPIGRRSGAFARKSLLALLAGPAVLGGALAIRSFGFDASRDGRWEGTPAHGATHALAAGSVPDSNVVSASAPSSQFAEEVLAGDARATSSAPIVGAPETSPAVTVRGTTTASAAKPVAAPEKGVRRDSTAGVRTPSPSPMGEGQGVSVNSTATARASGASGASENGAPANTSGVDLLREANRLRAEGRWAAAAATYRRVLEVDPTSADAYPAEVALGNLELQQNRPSTALALYQHVLASRPSGALSEEARWGKARALRATGRTSEERAALEEFCARHSESPLVPAATQRLLEIGN